MVIGSTPPTVVATQGICLCLHYTQQKPKGDDHQAFYRVQQSVGYQAVNLFVD